MKLNLDQEKDKCFMHLFSQEVKFPHNLNVDKLIQKEEPSSLEVVMRQMDEMRKDMLHMKNEQEKPKPYFSLESICLCPFDKYL